MNIFDVQTKVGESGEYILGAERTGSHACYLIYGVMKPKEKGRKLKAGAGHEELFLAIKGDFLVSGHDNEKIKQGQSFHLQGEQAFLLENVSDTTAVYVMSGGHSDTGHH